METQQTNDSSPKNQHPAKKVKPEKTSVLKKLDPETGRVLKLLKDKINKKNYGRSVRDTEIIAAALRLIQPEHIKDLQENTLSERDRLAIAHEEYQKTNGKISLDQFIGKLLKGENTKN